MVIVHGWLTNVSSMRIHVDTPILFKIVVIFSEKNAGDLSYLTHFSVRDYLSLLIFPSLFHD